MRRWLRVLALGALIAAEVGTVASGTALAQPSPPGVPTADSPALPHGAQTLQSLAGGQPAVQAAAASAAVQGVDVASYQHPGGAAINWGQVASAGYRFAFVKATQGNYYTNPYFAGDYAAVAAAGMLRSAYHFADPGVSSGTAQADYLLNAAPYTADSQTLAPALDLENVQGSPFCYGLSTSGMVAWVIDFSNEIWHGTGRLPIIYTRAGWWNQCTGNSGAFNGNPLWVASYGASSPTLPAGWPQWTYWQWTSTGSVPGISGNVDLSYFNGNASAVGPSTWGSLGGSLASGPGVASWAADRLDVFAADSASGGLLHRWWDGANWYGFEGLGGLIAGGTSPAAVSWGRNRVDVFVRGVDGGLYHKWWDGRAWNGWEALGGVLASSPTVASWAGGRLDVFVRGVDSSLYHKWWDGRAWNGWESLGGWLTSGPGATSWGPGRIDVFVGGTGNNLWHKYWDGTQWLGWESLGGALTSAPAASSWGPGRIDVVAMWAGGVPEHLFWANYWSSWSSLGGTGVGDPAVVDRSPGTIDAFVCGTDGALWHLPVLAG